MVLSSTPTNVSLVSMNWTFWDTTLTAMASPLYQRKCRPFVSFPNRNVNANYVVLLA